MAAARAFIRVRRKAGHVRTTDPGSGGYPAVAPVTGYNPGDMLGELGMHRREAQERHTESCHQVPRYEPRGSE